MLNTGKPKIRYDKLKKCVQNLTDRQLNLSPRTKQEIDEK